MAVGVIAGTKVGISATAPATWDITGYEALVFTNIGDIADPGEHGATFTEVTFQPIDKRTIQKFKGSRNDGNMSMQVGVNTEDAGQELLKDALMSDDSYYFEIEYPNGDKHWFPAKVMSMSYAGGNSDTIRMATVNLGLTTGGPNAVGIVEFVAP